MTWFKVDDNLALHTKVLRAGNEAIGMWVRAGSWSAQQLTDGHIPREIVAILGGDKVAARLVAVGLWHETEGGYDFHEWSERQPSRQKVERERAAAQERKAKWKERREERTRNAVPDAVPNADGTADATEPRPDPTRPDPKQEKDLGTADAAPNGGILLKRFLDSFKAKTGQPYPDRSKGHLAAQIGALLKVYDGEIVTNALNRLLERGLGPSKLPDLVADVLNPRPARKTSADEPEVYGVGGILLDSSML
jgi:hypothetical protein